MVGAELGPLILRASARLLKRVGDHVLAQSLFAFLLHPQSKIEKVRECGEPNIYGQGFLLPPSDKSPSQRRQHFHSV